MLKNILFSVQELRKTQQNNQCIIVDCRFVLDDPEAGYKDYLESHIHGAVYAHLNDDLSSPVTLNSGRHPLPDAEKFASFLGRSGWRPGIVLVVYDDVGGAIAARLWWLMRYFGHDCAALLNGGIQAWKAAGFQLDSGPASITSVPIANFSLCDDLVMSTPEIIEGLNSNAIVLADARAAERFSGDIEPIDAVAGHIPGAVNYPFHRSLVSNGMFKSVEKVHSAMLKLTGRHQAQDLVHMCGSGVTACHNIFAAELAGLPGSRLYVGSWSEWIRDPSRPIEP